MTSTLTDIQWRILELMRDGYSQEEIGVRLGLTTRAVKWQAMKMRKAAGVKRTRQLVRWAQENGR